MKCFHLLLLALLSSVFSFAQVGVNTTTIDPSAALDIQYGSTPKGLLTPRMTTVQRTAIATPADGLMVYDTDLKAFFHYKSAPNPGWIKLSSDLSGRTNFKRIKSAADLSVESTAGGATSYRMLSNTFYEINGTVVLTKPIDLNDAYVAGIDANEDVLSFPGGTVFSGSTGGSIKNITLRGARAFNITGPGIATSTSLLVQNTIISGMTTNVGTISGLGLYFGGIIQFVGNTNGITYSNIGNLLLDNQAWLDSNNGTFETFTGNFGLIEKGSGFSAVNGNDLAMDVSALTATSVATGILQGTAFLGTTSNTAGFIKGYTPANGSYTGYNFNNVWYVDAPGIPREGDAEATGDINLDAVVGSGITTTFPAGTGVGTRIKVAGTTTSNSLFRFTKDGNNRITYRGNKTRYFQVSASLSYQGSAADMTLILYIARNGVIMPETKVYGRPSTGFFSSAGILALPIVGTVQLKKDDYIEIWAERFDGTGNISTVSLNLTAR